MNCWEFKECDDKEGCPVYPYHGKECALYLNTKCHGIQKETFKENIRDCYHCHCFRSGFHGRSAE
jgi:hypothetical protein